MSPTSGSEDESFIFYIDFSPKNEAKLYIMYKVLHQIWLNFNMAYLAIVWSKTEQFIWILDK